MANRKAVGCRCCYGPCCEEYRRYRASPGNLNTIFVKNIGEPIEGPLSETVELYHNSLGTCLMATLEWDADLEVWYGSGTDISGGGVSYDIELWYSECCCYCVQPIAGFGGGLQELGPAKQIAGRLTAGGTSICLRAGAAPFASAPSWSVASLTEHPPVWLEAGQFGNLPCKYRSWLCPEEFPGILEEVPGIWNELKDVMPRFLWRFPKSIRANFNGASFPVWYHTILFSTEVDFQPEIPGTDTWDRVTSECDTVQLSGDYILTNGYPCPTGPFGGTYIGTEGDYDISIGYGMGGFTGAAMEVRIQRSGTLTAQFPFTTGPGDWQLVNRDAVEGEPLGASQICGAVNGKDSDTKKHPSFLYKFNSTESFPQGLSYCKPLVLGYAGQWDFSGYPLGPNDCGKLDPCPSDDRTPALMPSANVTLEWIWD